ncbi:hypothetical protein ACFO3H_15860 [Halorussus sp. GCM10023401]
MLAVLLVVSTAVAPALIYGVGTVTAAGTKDADDCKFMDSQNNFVQVVASIEIEALQFAHCVAGDLLEDSDVSGLAESEAQQVLHSKAAGINASENNQLASRYNYVQDSRFIAMSEARTRAAQSLDNHSTKTESIRDARIRVADYYSRMEHNSVKIQSANVERIRSMYAVKQNENITYNISVSIQDPDTYGAYLKSYDSVTFTNGTTTLENGTVVNVTKVKVVNATVIQTTTTSDQTCYQGNFTNTYDEGYIDNVTSNCTYNSEGEQTLRLVAQPPQDYNTKQEVYDGKEWRSHYSAINESHTYVSDNIAATVDSVYANVSASDIDGSRLLSPVDLARQSTGSYSTSGHYSSTVAYAAMRGYETNTTAAMKITYNGSTYEGMLFTRATPPTNENGTNVWKANYTYNASNMTKPVYFAAQSSADKTRVKTLDGPFAIKTINNTKTGESMNSTTPEQFTYKDTSYTNIKEQNDDMKKVLVTVDQDTVAGKQLVQGLFDFMGDNPIWVIGLIVGGLVVLILVKDGIELYLP